MGIMEGHGGAQRTLEAVGTHMGTNLGSWWIGLCAGSRRCGVFHRGRLVTAQYNQCAVLCLVRGLILLMKSLASMGPAATVGVVAAGFRARGQWNRSPTRAQLTGNLKANPGTSMASMAVVLVSKGTWGPSKIQLLLITPDLADASAKFGADGTSGNPV